MEQKKERYIIAVDMDGTLLNSQGKITKRTADVLQRLEVGTVWNKRRKDTLLQWTWMEHF